MNPELLTSLGAAAAIFLSSAGSVYASIHGGLFALKSPYSLFEGLIPIVIGGVLSIYGFIVAVLLCGKIGSFSTTATPTTNIDEDGSGGLSDVDGYRNLSAGLAVGLACLCSGWGIGKFIHLMMTTTTTASAVTREDDATQPLLAEQRDVVTAHVSFPKSIVRIVLVLIFLEAIGLYGLIVSLFLMSQDSKQ